MPSQLTSGMLIGKWRCDLWNLNWNDTNFWHSDMQLKLNLQSSGFRKFYTVLLSSPSVSHVIVHRPGWLYRSYTPASTSSCRVRYEIYSHWNIVRSTSKNERSVVYLSSPYFSHLLGEWIGGGWMDCSEISERRNVGLIWVNSSSLCQFGLPKLICCSGPSNSTPPSSGVSRRQVRVPYL